MIKISQNNFPDKNFRVIRERVIFEHLTPDERIITDEITVLNITEQKLRSIFLIRDEFMVGLKIFDAKNRELPYYTNDFAIKLLNEERTLDCLGESIHKNLLDKMKERKAFLLWISLPEQEPLHPNESMILKLTYTNKIKSLKPKIKELLNIFSIPSKILFNTPKFRVTKIKPNNLDYDTFYLIHAPNEYTLSYKINKAIYVDHDNKKQNIDKSKLHENFDGKILFIRIPYVNGTVEFDLQYYVTPTNYEKWFYAIAVFGSIAVSLVMLYVGLSTIPEEKPQSFLIIKKHLTVLYAAIFTGSIGAIGFTRGFAVKKTRFWFLIPMIISIIGFLFYNEH
jgi:hypothetical protein